MKNLLKHAPPLLSNLFALLVGFVLFLQENPDIAPDLQATHLFGSIVFAMSIIKAFSKKTEPSDFNLGLTPNYDSRVRANSPFTSPPPKRSWFKSLILLIAKPLMIFATKEDSKLIPNTPLGEAAKEILKEVAESELLSEINEPTEQEPATKSRKSKRSKATPL